MRGCGKGIAAVLAAAVLLLIINCLLFKYVGYSGGYSRSSDIYGGEYFADTREEEAVLGILNGLPSDGNAAENELNARLAELKLCHQAAEIMAGNDILSAEISGEDYAERRANAQPVFDKWRNGRTVKPSQAAEKIQSEISLLKQASERLAYVNNYSEYIAKISENTLLITELSLFGENENIAENARRTARDFSAVRNVKPEIASDIALASLINFKIADILAALSVLLVIPGFSAYKRCISAELYARRSVLFLHIFIAFLTAVLIYISCYLMADSVAGGIPLSVPLQSFRMFGSCCYPINTGEFLLIMLLSKMGGIMLAAACLLLTLSLSGKAKMTAIGVITAAFAAEILLSAVDFSVFAREINLLSLFSAERFFLRYLNLNIGGDAVSRLPVFTVFSAVIILAAAISSAYALSEFSRKNRAEAEQKYFAEINRRYDEARKLRHDITNHLLAVGNLIDSGNIDGARKYISEVTERCSLAAQPIRTGSEVSDALLFAKSSQALQNGVTLDFEISTSLAGCGISDWDFCTIFGNIIDNATRAVSVLPSEKRKIIITVGRQLDMIYISCENLFSGEIVRRGERLMTTKPDAFSHGMGLSRVTEAAEKYGGTVKISHEDNTFLIEILLNKNDT